MSILIEGLDMPKSCEECPLFFEYYNPIEKKNIFHCRARWEGETRFADDFDWKTKPTHEEGCPLVEVEQAPTIDDARSAYLGGHNLFIQKEKDKWTY